MSMRLSIYFPILLMFLCNCSKEKKERGVSYYPNGQLKHEVLLVNGKPEGLGIIYYQNGNVKSRTHWKDGKKYGKSTHYFESGILQQETYYNEDIRQCTKDYTEDGFQRKVRKYDSLGRLVDFFMFNKDGTRDFTQGTKDPIFITMKDTISVGESFSAEIRLGNRQFGNIDVIIGDINNPYLIQNNPPLPKKDSVTSVFTYRADSAGLQKVSGVVIDRNSASDSLDVIPFIYPLFVREN